MDENKVQKLREIGYSIGRCCGLCQHFLNPSDTRSMTTWPLFGRCDWNRYEHRKHDNPDGGTRLGVVVFGACPDWTAREANTLLGSYGEFLR